APTSATSRRQPDKKTRAPRGLSSFAVRSIRDDRRHPRHPRTKNVGAPLGKPPPEMRKLHTVSRSRRASASPTPRRRFAGLLSGRRHSYLIRHPTLGSLTYVARPRTDGVARRGAVRA